MKVHTVHFSTLALLLVSMFSLAARSDAQARFFNPLSGSPRLRAGTVPSHSPSAEAPVPLDANHTTLYNFCSATNCTDGGSPAAALVRDAAGNLYGTTNQGGATGVGTVFKVDPSGNETILHSFTGSPDGAYPHAGLTIDASGNLYGTTYGGGNNNCNSAFGCGTAFEIDNAGHESVVYSFCSEGGQNCTDGLLPEAGLIQDNAGNLYGTTAIGGAKDAGTVFELDTAGHETVLYSFCQATNCADGNQPWASLIRDDAGNLYGTTVNGGANSGSGTVFKLDTAGHETVLYSFCSAANCTDGSLPEAALIRDDAGNLYGTTLQGGASDSGTAFKLDTTGRETVLLSLNGAYPTASLIADAAGDLYGTTESGGSHGQGTVFEIDPAGFMTVIFDFNGFDGSSPRAALISDTSGNLYGTTSSGGTSANGDGVGGGGTVFKLAPTAILTLTSSPNPSYANESVNLSVQAAGLGPTPTGSVTFQEGKTVLGTAILVNGTATLAKKLTRIGKFTISVNYSGDQNYAAAYANLVSQVILKQNTTRTTAASNLNPSTYGQAVTLTATVSSAGPTPTGTVTFKNGTKTLGSATLSSGVAALTVSTLPAGSLTIEATYGGDAASKKSTSPALPQTVNPATSATAVVSSVNPSKAGQTVKFTATVTSPTTTPTGTVTFMDGTTTLGTGNLAKGKASFSTSSLSVGSHNITAVYATNANIIGSMSTVLVQTVN